jgi:hypothetical protein
VTQRQLRSVRADRAPLGLAIVPGKTSPGYSGLIEHRVTLVFVRDLAPEVNSAEHFAPPTGNKIGWRRKTIGLSREGVGTEAIRRRLVESTVDH